MLHHDDARSPLSPSVQRGERGGSFAWLASIGLGGSAGFLIDTHIVWFVLSTAGVCFLVALLSGAGNPLPALLAALLIVVGLFAVGWVAAYLYGNLHLFRNGLPIVLPIYLFLAGVGAGTGLSGAFATKWVWKRWLGPVDQRITTH